MKKAVASAAEEDAEQLAARQIDRAVDVVGEMQLTSEQVRVRAWHSRAGTPGLADGLAPPA